MLQYNKWLYKGKDAKVVSKIDTQNESNKTNHSVELFELLVKVIGYNSCQILPQRQRMVLIISIQLHRLIE